MTAENPKYFTFSRNTCKKHGGGRGKHGGAVVGRGNDDNEYYEDDGPTSEAVWWTLAYISCSLVPLPPTGLIVKTKTIPKQSNWTHSLHF